MTEFQVKKMDAKEDRFLVIIVYIFMVKISFIRNSCIPFILSFIVVLAYLLYLSSFTWYFSETSPTLLHLLLARYNIFFFLYYIFFERCFGHHVFSCNVKGGDGGCSIFFLYHWRTTAGFLSFGGW